MVLVLATLVLAAGAVMRYGTQEKTFSGGCDDTTNNRMELFAAILLWKNYRVPVR